MQITERNCSRILGRKHYRNRHYEKVQKQEDNNFPKRAFEKESGIHMIITFDWNLSLYLSRQNWYTTLHRLPLSPTTG